MKKNELKAFAKINLILKVLNKRTDNYHNIFSLMQKIDLYDVITIEKKTENNIEIVCDKDLGITQEENIVYKTAMALKEYTNYENGALIKIKKNIPVGAGLGGGSSDAATTLILLNNIWRLKLTKDELHNIAIELGSDVPFFLESFPKWVYGKGEYCQKLDCIRKVNETLKQTGFGGKLLIIYPKIHINTEIAYQKLNRKQINIKIDENTYTDLILDYENELNSSIKYFFLKKNMCNDFEEEIFDLYPEIKKIYDDLTELSDGMARLTGSGSALFAILSVNSNANAKIKKLRKKYTAKEKDYLLIKTKFVL